MICGGPLGEDNPTRRRRRRRWSRNHFCRPEKLFFFLILSARFISPNQFSTDSSETMHIFAFTLSPLLERYINMGFHFSSRLIHAAGLSQRKFCRGFTAIFYSEDWKVTDTDSGRAFTFSVFFFPNANIKNERKETLSTSRMDDHIGR